MELLRAGIHKDQESPTLSAHKTSARDSARLSQERQSEGKKVKFVDHNDELNDGNCSPAVILKNQMAIEER